MAVEPTEETPRVSLQAWLVTDIGVVREHNEDSAFMEPTRGFFIVADGMGGHAAGEVASAMAVESVKTTLSAAHVEIDAFKKAPTDTGRRSIVQLLQNAVLSAHQAVFERGQAEADKQGMGTTLDVVLIAGPEAFIAHVGDSRTYRIRDGKITQITTDHTVAEVLVIEGKLTIEEAQVSPLRTILVNAIGVSQDVGVEMGHVTLRRDDRILLCSDGLHDYFPHEAEIAERLSAAAPGAALAEMVELAKVRGGHDNITGVTVHILDVVGAVPAALDGESTQPLDGGPNPFAADEPTQTSLPQSGLGARLGTLPTPSARATQPMRVVVDDADSLGDTIPPMMGLPKVTKAKAKDDGAWDGNTDELAPVPPPADAPGDAVPTATAPDATADTGRIVVPDDKR